MDGKAKNYLSFKQLEIEFQALLTDNTRLNIDADFLRKDRDRLAEENEEIKAIMGELVEALKEAKKTIHIFHFVST